MTDRMSASASTPSAEDHAALLRAIGPLPLSGQASTMSVRNAPGDSVLIRTSGAYSQARLRDMALSAALDEP